MLSLSEVKTLLMAMGLNRYQASVLTALLFLGETKATVLSRVSGVPTARVYGVLNDLVKMGLVTVKPGRPSRYSPIPPEDIVNSVISWSLEEMRRKVRRIEELGRRFVEAASEIYLAGRRGLARRPLIRVISVGEVSEEETRKLYDTAENEILILSQAFEYFPSVSDRLLKAAERGVHVRIILKTPERLDLDQRRRQEKTLASIDEVLNGKVDIRFAEDVPLRGCIIDPHRNGGALFLVEEAGVPFEFREAALTFNPGLVKALTLTFNLLWSSAKRLNQ